MQQGQYQPTGSMSNFSQPDASGGPSSTRSSTNQLSEPCTPTVRNPDRPMHRNLSDLGPRFKKRVTYRSMTSTEPMERPPSFSEEPQPLTPILKKSNVCYYDRGRDYTTVHGVSLLREESCDFDSLNTEGDQLSEEALETDSEPNSTHTSPRTDRFPSYNSTESDLVSDAEDGSAQEDGDSLSGRDSRERKPLLDRNSHTFHMKPESQALLMRPEVLKLRKTTC